MILCLINHGIIMVLLAYFVLLLGQNWNKQLSTVHSKMVPATVWFSVNHYWI